MTTTWVQTAAVYLASVVLLSAYGMEVCPFLDTLHELELGLTIAAAYLLGWVARELALGAVRKRNAAWDLASSTLPYRYLALDLAVWTAVGLALTVWNLVHHEFPAASGFKLTLGSFTLGLFSASYLALGVEEATIRRLASQPGLVAMRGGSFLSVSTRLAAYFGVSVLVVGIVISLLVARDFRALESGELPPGEGLRSTVGEIVFAVSVLVAMTLLVARRYTRNLRLLFELQIEAFRGVERGDYDAFVPIATNDEFALIAEKTNQLILGLKEKERIRQAFGKYMSPAVAEAILGSEKGPALGGRLAEVAVLFVDIRNYTPLSERLAPPEVVALLNSYFDVVVKAVHAQDGVLDKFIGDAAMAVFGLAGSADACDRAAKAAIDIHSRLARLNERHESLGVPAIECGIGLHFGPVVAGNIGSPERLEYTVIGDTVNTASRLETLTKELASPIALSQAVHDRLGDAARGRFRRLGEYSLKGKAGKTAVYGPVAPDRILEPSADARDTP